MHMERKEKVLLDHLIYLYGKNEAPQIYQGIGALMDQFQRDNQRLTVPDPKGKINEQDVILITYGDMLKTEGEMPLKTLGGFLKDYLDDVISTIHILPFFPYSSDDGFSVIDYRQVNPEIGDWDDISDLRKSFRLMFDAVVNHCSSQSAMFKGFLKGDPDFEGYFTVVEPGTDTSKIFRPRATPVVTPYDTVDGEKLIWTTFSADQVDLNFKNPAVLLEIIDILLFYTAHGADFIRFDAVTYVWKEIGTSSINLPQTHRFVQLMRTILDIVAPNVVIITETNVPHKDNIAYFGDGTNEAQMVYNFALPLLTLHSFISKNVSILSAWAMTLDLPSNQTAFFNFLACHDGIGMLPVKGILPEREVGKIIERVHANGGFVSYKSDEDGTQSPYELNISYLDALRDSDAPIDDLELIAKRFLATQAIMLSLRGVPGIYFHSLFGSENWEEGVKETGRNRTINREKLEISYLKAELARPESLRSLIYQGFCDLLKARKQTPAFHPFGEQVILDLHPAVFALMRTSPDGSSHILCLHNVSNQLIDLEVKLPQFSFSAGSAFFNLITGNLVPGSEIGSQLQLDPYEVLWLRD